MRAGAATQDDRCEGAATARLPSGRAREAAAASRPALAVLGVTRSVSIGNPHEVASLGAGSWGPAAAGGVLICPVSADAFVLT